MSDRADRKHVSAMRFEELNSFVDVAIKAWNLSPTAVSVWIVLFRFARPDSRTIVSDHMIAKLLGCSDRTVRNATSELASKGALRVIKAGAPGMVSIRTLLPYEPPAQHRKDSSGERRKNSSGEHRKNSAKTAERFFRHTERTSPSDLFLTERRRARPPLGRAGGGRRAEQKKPPTPPPTPRDDAEEVREWRASRQRAVTEAEARGELCITPRMQQAFDLEQHHVRAFNMLSADERYTVLNQLRLAPDSARGKLARLARTLKIENNGHAAAPAIG